MAKKAARKLPKAVSDFFAAAGRKGGAAKGPSKARDPEKMREAQKKSVEARKAKREAEEPPASD